MTHICVTNPSIFLIGPGGDLQNSVRPRWVNSSQFLQKLTGVRKWIYNYVHSKRFTGATSLEVTSKALDRRISIVLTWITSFHWSCILKSHGIVICEEVGIHSTYKIRKLTTAVIANKNYILLWVTFHHPTIQHGCSDTACVQRKRVCPSHYSFIANQHLSTINGMAIATLLPCWGPIITTSPNNSDEAWVPVN